MSKGVDRGIYEDRIYKIMSLKTCRWVVGLRINKWVEITYNHEEPVFLPYQHEFTRLYVEFVHAVSHSGVATTMAKVRLRYWVVNLKRMVKSICA